MKRYRPGIQGITGYACVREHPQGEYVAYADVQAMHQLLLDLISRHHSCELYVKDDAELHAVIERARQLTETSHTDRGSRL